MISAKLTVSFVISGRRSNFLHHERRVYGHKYDIGEKVNRPVFTRFISAILGHTAHFKIPVIKGGLKNDV